MLLEDIVATEDAVITLSVVDESFKFVFEIDAYCGLVIFEELISLFFSLWENFPWLLKFTMSVNYTESIKENIDININIIKRNVFILLEHTRRAVLTFACLYVKPHLMMTEFLLNLFQSVYQVL